MYSYLVNWTTFEVAEQPVSAEELHRYKYFEYLSDAEKFMKNLSAKNDVVDIKLMEVH